MSGDRVVGLGDVYGELRELSASVYALSSEQRAANELRTAEASALRDWQADHERRVRRLEMLSYALWVLAAGSIGAGSAGALLGG